MGKPLKSDQMVLRWGRCFGVRIPAATARAAGFTRGLPITVEVVNGGIFLCAASKPRLTLAQKLQAFDSEIHGGEAMPYVPVGKETL